MLALSACGRLGFETLPSGEQDAGRPDAGFDAGALDAGEGDAGPVEGMDASAPDAGMVDAGSFEAGVLDASLSPGIPCVPGMAQLHDGFDDAVIGADWRERDAEPALTIQETASELQVVFAPMSAEDEYAGLESRERFDLRGSSVTLEVLEVPSPATAAIAFFKIGDGANVYDVEIVTLGGQLVMRRRVGGRIQGIHAVTHVPSAHRFWRIREVAGVVFFEVSADGDIFFELASTTYGFAPDRVEIDFGAGSFAVETDAGRARFEQICMR